MPAFHLTETAHPAVIAGRIAAIYLLLAFGWIYFSDRTLEFLIADPVRLSFWQTGKGWLFVLVSAALIYFLVCRALQAQKDAVNETAQTLFDLQVRKESEAKIRIMNDDLQRQTLLLAAANRELEAFSYSVSHDLRAPLRAVDGFTRILLEEHAPQLDAEGHRICGIISENSRKMGQLIDDLLTFSRLGRAPLKIGTVDVATLAATIYEEITTPQEREQIDLHIEPLPPGCGDPALLRQVLTNLLANAVKFTGKKDGARIRLQAASAGDEIVYSVVDNGAGFDMRYADKLFGVFQRLHSAREFDGTGVGLAIAQRIIERHGGRIWGEGVPGVGATFSFTLYKQELADGVPAGD